MTPLKQQTFLKATGGSVTLLACAMAAAYVAAVSTQAGATVADRVLALTRVSAWRLEAAVPVGFRTHHPQGMVKIGDSLFVSAVEVRIPTERYPRPAGGFDRSAGDGTGHLFKIDMHGRRLGSVTLGEGTMYHPGGIDYDGTHIWVSVAEYRPDSRSIVYRVDPATMTATEVFRFADHIGAIVHNTDDRTLHGVSWGSRRFYRWTLGADGSVTNAATTPERLRTLNPSHYVDYQDCQYVGDRRMLCGGVADLPSPDARTFRLGGIALVSLVDGRPIHQAPALLWTKGGRPMTQNPVWFEAAASGLRGYFMPDDDSSTLYVYTVDTP